MHPSKALSCTKSRLLNGKKIVLAITGSVASIQSFELSRELMRHGAQVHVVMTQDAVNFITPTSMHFATGNEITTAIDGRTQHVSFFGEYEGKADMLLISPCTANTISKVANGIDDTPVTTMATVAIGSKTPVVIVPAMNLAMYENPAVQRNIRLLKDMGVFFIGPNIVGKKAKNAETGEIVDSVISILGSNTLSGKKVLVIGGATREEIDDVRVISNVSTGESALYIALEAFHRGADVEIWHGSMSVSIPAHIPSKSFHTVEDLIRMIDDASSYDIILVPAALSDYAPIKSCGKISSDLDEITITLQKLPKVLPLLRKHAGILVGFKAETVSGTELISKAKGRLEAYNLDMIVANNVHDVCQNRTKAEIILCSGEIISFEGSKTDLANAIFEHLKDC